MRFDVWRDFGVRLIDIAVGGEGYSGYLLVYSIHVDVGQLRKDDDQELNQAKERDTSSYWTQIFQFLRNDSRYY